MPKKTAPKKAAAKSAKTALPSASLPEADRVDVGSRYAVTKLTDLAKDVLPRVHRAPFARFGFDARWVSAIEALVAEIDVASARTQDARDGSLPTGEALDAAVAATKAWRRDAMTVVSITASLRAKATHIAAGSSIAKLVQSVKTLLPLVGQASAVSSGGGPAMKAAGALLLTKLAGARDAHKAGLGKLTPEVRALNAAKGILYEELRRVATAARAVVPAEAHLFAVSAHVRSQHVRKRPVVPSKPVTSPAKADGASPP